MMIVIIMILIMICTLVIEQTCSFALLSAKRFAQLRQNKQQHIDSVMVGASLANTMFNVQTIITVSSTVYTILVIIDTLFIGWSNNRCNNLRFISSLVTSIPITCFGQVKCRPCS